MTFVKPVNKKSYRLIPKKILASARIILFFMFHLVYDFFDELLVAWKPAL